MPPAPSLKSAQALSSDVARACREINALTDKIKNVETGRKGMFDKDCPLEDVVIKKAKRVDK